MAQASIVQDGIDRVQDAVKQVDKRYRQLTKEADKRRKSFEKEAEKRVRTLQKDIRNARIVKRAEGLREDASRRIEEQVDQILSVFRIASQSEVDRLDRKVSQLTRKLRELERSSEAA